MKKLISFLVVIVLALVISAIAVVTLINPNQFKPVIIEQTRKTTGLDLIIQGDIHWQFFPSIGLSIGPMELKNPPGYAQADLIKIDHASVAVSLLPILNHTLNFGQIHLDGATISLETLADGRSNMDTFRAPKTAPKGETSPVTSMEDTPPVVRPKSGEPWRVSVSGLSITHASVFVVNHQKGSELSLSDVNMGITNFVPDRWASLTFSASGKMNADIFSLHGSSKLKWSGSVKSLAAKEMQLQLSGRFGHLQLNKATVFLDAYLADKAGTLTWSLDSNQPPYHVVSQGQAQLMVASDMNRITLDQLAGNVKLSSEKGQSLTMNLQSNVVIEPIQKVVMMSLSPLRLNQALLNGKIALQYHGVPSVDMTLHSDDLNVDALLSSVSARNEVSESQPDSPNVGSSISKVQPSPVTEPDLSGLKGFNLTAHLALDKAQIHQVSMQNVLLDVTNRQGQVVMNPFKAQLYEGGVHIAATLDATHTPVTYQVHKQVSGVQIQPLMEAVADNGVLEGKGNLTVDVSGRGLTDPVLKQNLKGKVTIALADGAINGINLPLRIRTTYARIKGQTLTDENQVKKTDFSALTGTFDLNHGVATTQNLVMQSPLLRIRGTGQINYVDQSLDLGVNTSIVGSLEGQGGKGIDELKDVTIPLKITGPWKKPVYRLTFDDVLKNKAKKELDRGLKKLDKKMKDEKTKEAVNQLLKGLFK